MWTVRWLNLLIAALQAGWGPFIAVYLTAKGWGQGEIGLVLTVGTVAGMAAQVPAGWLVDNLADKRIGITISLAVLGVAALLMAILPSGATVFTGIILHGIASSVIAPSISALTLLLTGHADFAEQAGINTRWQSLGNLAASAMLGFAGTSLGVSVPLLFTGMMALPAMAVALTIPLAVAPKPPEAVVEHAAMIAPGDRRAMAPVSYWSVLRRPGLLLFTAAIVLFSLANGAMLTIALDEFAKRDAPLAASVTAGSVIVSQLVVAALAPWIGRAAKSRGRRFVLLLGFAALPLRGLIFVLLPGVVPLLSSEALDGISGAVFGVAVPLIAADLTSEGGGFNLAMAICYLALGLGGALSTTVAGALAGYASFTVSLSVLTAFGAAGFLLVLVAMPETKPLVMGAIRLKKLPAAV
jgi:MFS family permease